MKEINKGKHKCPICGHVFCLDDIDDYGEGIPAEGEEQYCHGCNAEYNYYAVLTFELQGVDVYLPCQECSKDYKENTGAIEFQTLKDGVRHARWTCEACKGKQGAKDEQGSKEEA